MDSKVIVITGASSGIGAALAKHLGGQQHRLVLASRNEIKLKDVAQSIASPTQVVVTDVTRRLDMEQLRDRALSAFGQVDVWINNAGRGITRNVLDLSSQDFDEIMAVNVKSALYGIQAIVPHFKKCQAGHLINISSFLGRVPLASFRSAYNAAKAALNALTANLRMDLAHEFPGIHVSLVMPGMVATDFSKNALGGVALPPPNANSMQIQTAEEVAAIIADLIEKPQAEIYTNPASAELARLYFQDVAAFESKR